VFVTTVSSSVGSVSFASLQLAQPLLDALVADGYEHPTPIQAQAIPPAVSGRDVLGIAQTGTGKTAAFALPILNHLLERLPRGSRPPLGRKPKALVLSPTRELAAQIAESFSSYGRHTPLRFAVIFGGVGQGPQVRAIQQGVDILVATPGRLIDLLQQRLVNLGEIDFFVLDEADRMLDMGFIEPIRKIAAMLPSKRQTMLFSATMPKEIRHLADSLLSNPVQVAVTPVSSAVDRIDQKLYFVLKAQKTQLLVHLFDSLAMDRAVVFTKTKHGADRVCRKLKAAGIHAEAIHGDKAQNQRTRALDAFRSGRSPILVATDVAARGLDIDDVTHVVNYDLPMEPEAYVHRIGRTARAGKSGHAISFCDVEEKGLLKQVERLIKFEIPRERVPIDVPKSDEAAARAAIHGHAAVDAGQRSEQPRAPRSEPQRAPQHASKHDADSRHHAPRNSEHRAPSAAPRENAPRHFAGPNARRPQPNSHPASDARDESPRGQERPEGVNARTSSRPSARPQEHVRNSPSRGGGKGGAHSSGARESSSGARESSSGARESSSGARGSSSGARGSSSGARGSSSGARGSSSGARGASSGARESSSGARGASSGARGSSSGARGSSSGARGGGFKGKRPTR
jgi:ATP-dependent RNA helicase RhlE